MGVISSSHLLAYVSNGLEQGLVQLSCFLAWSQLDVLTELICARVSSQQTYDVHVDAQAILLRLQSVKR